MSPRKHGLIMMVYGAFAIAVAVTLTNWLLPKFGYELEISGLFAFAMCGAYFLTGLTEVITNRSFAHWGQKWMALKGWQRGVFGTLFLVLIVIVLGCAIPYVA